jgi:carboxyl-terminal processing protease
VLRFPQGITGIAVAAVLFVLGYVSGHARLAPHDRATPGPETGRQLELLGKVLDIVQSDYVDKLDDGKLVNAAINGILGAIDPRSNYEDAKTFRDAQVSGYFAGLGFLFMMDDGVLKVVSPIDDTPAARAGLLAGDIINEIDDIPVKGFSPLQAAEKLRGGPGTDVRLEIMRLGQAAPRNLTLTRQMIKVPTVRQRAEGGDVGYVRITQFGSQAADELNKAIATLATTAPPEQFKGYILDLRNNPGGLLDQAVRVAGAF